MSDWAVRAKTDAKGHTINQMYDSMYSLTVDRVALSQGHDYGKIRLSVTGHDKTLGALVEGKTGEGTAHSFLAAYVMRVAALRPRDVVNYGMVTGIERFIATNKYVYTEKKNHIVRRYALGEKKVVLIDPYENEYAARTVWKEQEEDKKDAEKAAKIAAKKKTQEERWELQVLKLREAQAARDKHNTFMEFGQKLYAQIVAVIEATPPSGQDRLREILTAEMEYAESIHATEVAALYQRVFDYIL